MEAAYHAAVQDAERAQAMRREATASSFAPQCFDLSPKGETMKVDVPPVSFEPQPPFFAGGVPLGATPWGGNVAGLGPSFPGLGTVSLLGTVVNLTHLRQTSTLGRPL